MRYKQYIASKEWKQKRCQRLDFDSNMCAICHGTNNLSVHHLHYESLGNEDIVHDLITACGRCHRYLDAIERYNRYKKRKHNVDTASVQIQERENVKHGLANSIVPVSIILSDDRTQRADGKSSKQMVKIDETDFIKARQDRC